MSSTLNAPRRGSRPQAISGLLVGVALVTLLAGCGSKSASQQASDELNAGLAAQKAGNMDLATQHYKACLAKDPTKTVCIFDLGTIAQAAGQTLQAESDYRLALIQDPNYTPAIFNLAIIRAGAGSTAEAIALYRHFVELAPDDPSGHLNLGLLLRATGDAAGATTELAEAQRLNPSIVIPSEQPSASASPAASPSASP
jgi:tetratricopeptide (TPR) repeat protein